MVSLIREEFKMTGEEFENVLSLLSTALVSVLTVVSATKKAIDKVKDLDPKDVDLIKLKKRLADLDDLATKIESVT